MNKQLQLIFPQCKVSARPLNDNKDWYADLDRWISPQKLAVIERMAKSFEDAYREKHPSPYWPLPLHKTLTEGEVV